MLECGTGTKLPTAALATTLEGKISDYLGVSHLEYVSNGTVALQIAINALGLKGEIITTPYSYVATTNSILWQNCKPVFADIDPKSLCIDPHRIESLINDNTTGIMATHVYGVACDVDAISAIASHHGLKVIYDGAHAFGVRLKGKSIFKYGDITTASFHATKIFHTIEGGAVVSKDKHISEKVFLSKTFGHRADEYLMAGINGKNSELHAAIGLCNLKVIDQVITARKAVHEQYERLLRDLPIQRLNIEDNERHNYAYYPVIFENHDKMAAVKAALEVNNIFPRRYFYPSLNKLPFLNGEACPISESISERVLCLPFYHDLAPESVECISKIIKDCF